MKITVELGGSTVTANQTTLKIKLADGEVLSLRVVDLGSHVDVVQGDGALYNTSWDEDDDYEVLGTATRHYRSEGAGFTGWIIDWDSGRNYNTEPISTKAEAVKYLAATVAAELKGEIVD